MSPRIALIVCGAAGFHLHCARWSMPAGGPEDDAPPRVVATEPEAMAVVPSWDGPVVIRFDEQISERGLEGAVSVSPESGEVDVDKGRSELRISVEGGWRPDRIYRIVVRPTLQDRRNNRRQEALDLIFSTGPPIPNTAVAGWVTDRLTRRPVPDARVELVRRADSVTYTAASDTAGLFALRHIPAGAYDVRAYLDRTPNREPDFSEPIDASDVVIGVTDTVVVGFALLPNDTTAARLMRAEAPDSLHVRVQLDDNLDPALPLDGLEAELLRLPDSTRVEVDSVLFPHEYRAIVEARRQALEDSLAALRPDSAAADSAAGAGVADSAAVAATPGDTARLPGVAAGPVARDSTRGAGPGGRAAEVAEDTVPLPTRELVIVPARPLSFETSYVVVLRGVTNIRGLTGGGGSAEFVTPAAPMPDPTAADSVPAGEVVPAPNSAPPPDTASAQDMASSRDTVSPQHTVWPQHTVSALEMSGPAATGPPPGPAPVADTAPLAARPASRVARNGTRENQ